MKKLEWSTGQWPTEPGFYFVYGQLWKAGAVELAICQVRPPANKAQGTWYECRGHFFYKSEQPKDLQWYGPIEEPPDPPHEAKIYR